jgi:hypothetical protein
MDLEVGQMLGTKFTFRVALESSIIINRVVEKCTHSNVSDHSRKGFRFYSDSSTTCFSYLSRYFEAL